ncbi:MAG: hypothetical protein ABSF50_17530 [Burkholderiaceae bacterium]|jgi:hypothetical protein
MNTHERSFALEAVLALLALSILTAVATACLLFRYQPMANTSGGVASRYDRWTGLVEYQLPECKASDVPMAWRQLGEHDPSWCSDLYPLAKKR